MRRTAQSGRMAAQGDGSPPASSARLGASKPLVWRNFLHRAHSLQPISARSPEAAGSKLRVQIAPASLVPSASLVLALPDLPRIAHCPATLLTHPLRSLEIKSFPIHGAPFLSIVPSARYISLSRGQARAAHLEGQRRDRHQSRAPASSTRASATSLKHRASRAAAAHHHRTTTLIKKALPAAPSSATTSSTSPSSSRRVLHPTTNHYHSAASERGIRLFISHFWYGPASHHHYHPSLSFTLYLARPSSSRAQPTSSSLYLSCSDTSLSDCPSHDY